MAKLYKIWMEYFLVILMLFGMLIAIFSPSAFISYIIILLSGIFAGRVLYERKNNIIFPFYMITAGFLIGFLIGAYYGSREIMAILFILGAFGSYLAFDRKILKDVRF